MSIVVSRRISSSHKINFDRQLSLSAKHEWSKRGTDDFNWDQFRLNARKVIELIIEWQIWTFSLFRRIFFVKSNKMEVTFFYSDHWNNEYEIYFEIFYGKKIPWIMWVETLIETVSLQIRYQFMSKMFDRLQICTLTGISQCSSSILWEDSGLSSGFYSCTLFDRFNLRASPIDDQIDFSLLRGFSVDYSPSVDRCRSLTNMIAQFILHFHR